MQIQKQKYNYAMLQNIIAIFLSSGIDDGKGVNWSRNILFNSPNGDLWIHNGMVTCCGMKNCACLSTKKSSLFHERHKYIGSY